MKKIPLTSSSDAFVAENYFKPSWATGSISREDAKFLFEVIRSERPRRVMEIGVASGVSTAFLSRILTSVDCQSKLFSFDALDYFYADRSRACGAVVLESFGKIPDNVKLLLGCSSSRIAKVMATEEKFDFCFIDANHRQPWPCLDLLSVIEVTKPGSWVALHDINLPFIHRNYPDYGPHYLFSSWPGERALGSGNIVGLPNIGAIRLFDRKEDSIRAVLDCMCLPWAGPAPDEAVAMAKEYLMLTAPSLVTRFTSTIKNLLDRPAISVRQCLLSGLNDWTTLEGAPWRKRFTLHSNRRNEPKAEITIEDLQASAGHIVFPSIFWGKGPNPLFVDVTVVNGSGNAIWHQKIEMNDSLPKVVVAQVDLSTPAKLTIGASIEGDVLGGAWAKFEPFYCV